MDNPQLNGCVFIIIFEIQIWIDTIYCYKLYMEILKINIRADCVIYKLTFPGGKSYIGQTIKGFLHRVKQHIASAERNANNCPLLENAIRKYGPEYIQVEILFSADTRDKLDEMEIKFIAEHKTLNPDGYNLSTGGEGKSGKESDESKKAKSLAHRKYRPDIVREQYVNYYIKDGIEGFRVRKPGHPSGNFRSSDMTFDEKLKLANEYARSLNTDNPIARDGYKQANLPYENIPRGFSYVSKREGFRVNIPGHSEKCFFNQSFTRDEKYALALKYYNETTKKLNGRMLAGEVDLQNDDAQDMA